MLKDFKIVEEIRKYQQSQNICRYRQKQQSRTHCIQVNEFLHNYIQTKHFSALT